ncbi:MAG: orotidine-5'-phosphate decarboxylase [Fusobacteria bacterium]|nr:MAG: orotidine-5'-phosphate decarboxylase [Fusobacteriota bacterium]KAF0229781.1 MAG: orotidine-5'-phosphate [Fusobacteriota bacterium]
MKAKDRLIVALDVDTKEEVEYLVNELKDDIGMFKVGLQLYTSMGSEIITYIKNRGGKVFLDLKLHDIPNTVSETVRVLTKSGVDMMNVHSQGGHAMMKLAKETSVKTAAELGIEAPLLIAVTILTSLGDSEVAEIGYTKSAKEMVEHLGILTDKAGLDGVVCSPLEAGIINNSCSEGFITVTPGVRPAGEVVGDQKRITTPGQAIQGGSTYIVVGRPITKAENVKEAAKKIVAEMEGI